MLEIARQVVPEAEFILGDMADVKLEGWFAAAVVWDSLFHIRRERRGEVFRLLSGWLEPGGSLPLSAGGSGDEGFTSEMFGQEFFYSGWEPEQTLALLREAGFEVRFWEVDELSSRSHIAAVARRHGESDVTALGDKKQSLTHLVREPGREGRSRPPLLLLLHGIGSNEEDLFGLAPYLDERFLVVSARAPVALDYGGYGWFRIDFTPGGMVADVEQAKRSLSMLPGFIEELVETYGADGRRVYLMGFSQGAMMSLALLLTSPEKVAGLVAMSGRLPRQVLELEPDREALAGKHVLVTHGLYDPVLPIENGRAVRDYLGELPVELTYREYPMAHEVSMESLRDVTQWLTETLDSGQGVSGE